MRMNQKGFANITIIILLAIILVGTGAYFALNGQITPLAPIFTQTPVPSSTESTPNPIIKACTQEAKLCPDGSYVGRSGPNCEFAVCPKTSSVVCTQEVKLCPDGSYVGRVAPNCVFMACPKTPPPLPKSDGQISMIEGQREGPFLLQKIYSTYVTGLNFREYPVAVEQGFPVTVHIGEIVSNGCTVTLTLIRIEGNTAIFIKKTDLNKQCPICLSSNTLIDTPFGSINVKDLQVGMLVWTIDKSGQRVLGVIQKTSRTLVPPAHQMVHLVFNDGRELFVSPGHLIIDGRTVGDLAPGDLYDGAQIITSNRVTYNDVATYDILPSGETGFYWANGILIDSTLH